MMTMKGIITIAFKTAQFTADFTSAAPGGPARSVLFIVAGAYATV